MKSFKIYSVVKTFTFIWSKYQTSFVKHYCEYTNNIEKIIQVIAAFCFTIYCTLCIVTSQKQRSIACMPAAWYFAQRNALQHKSTALHITCSWKYKSTGVVILPPNRVFTKPADLLLWWQLG